MVLYPVISKLTGKLVVLASASPRRLEILSNAGLRFEVVPSWFKETLDKRLFKAPHEYAVETAKQKALEVARRMPFKHLKTPDIVIGADTIVTVDGMILEKPADKDDAYRMLSSLSGKEHSVFTGVAIVLCHEKEHEEVDYQLVSFYEETRVKFADLSESMLWEYIDSGEPMDKAGGYGIQALGGMLVESVHGDFLNVVGFPLNHFCKQLDLIFNRRSSSSAELPPPSSRRRSSAAINNSTNHTPLGQNHHPISPFHKVERRGSEIEESSWTLVNSLSKHTSDEFRDSESTVLELNVTEHEHCEPSKEELQRIMELMDGFKASKALFTASKMCVFDLLQSGSGLDAAQLAHETGASLKGTECLLEACVSLGLLHTTERPCQKPVYENTDLARRFLLSDAPCSLLGHIRHCNDTLWPLYSHTESAVREGASQRDKAFSKAAKDSQEAKLRFMNAMHDVAKVTGRAVATAFDLSAFKTACDLGGCTGAMAYELARVHPGLSVTVFDVPAVVELRDGFLPPNAHNRVSFMAGDFFMDELPRADLYVLSRILHDCSDEKIHVLLRKISAACTPGCGLLLSEIFLSEGRVGPSRGLLQALGMSEGRQRSAAEYSALLQSHGFVTPRVARTDNFLDAMLCIKA